MGKGATAMVTSDKDWEIEDALRTLCRAKEIEKDPKLMAKVRELAKKKMTEMGGIAG